THQDANSKHLILRQTLAVLTNSNPQFVSRILSNLMISSIAQEISPSSRRDSILPPAPRSRGLPFHASSGLFFLLFHPYFPFSLLILPTLIRPQNGHPPMAQAQRPDARGRARRRRRVGGAGDWGFTRSAPRPGSAASARSTSHQEGVKAARADLYLARLGEHVRDDHVPDGTHGDTLKAELRGQATRRMYAHSGEDDDVHAGRGDIRDNGRTQQRTRARPPRTATLRERRLPHRARYTAPLSVQVRPAALSACRANG
ncbi:hypothetical protein K438DRAFT_1804258, partial [Mycena galopus ATCC 62051]